LAAARPWPERRQDCTVTPIAANGKIRQPQLTQGTPKLPHRRYRGIGARHLAERVVAQVEAAAGELGPRDAMCSKPSPPQFEADAAAFEYAVILVDRRNEVVL